MILTPLQRAVLAHVVVDPDKWLEHAVEHFGVEGAQAFLEAKVARWQSEYESAVKDTAYLTRAEKDAQDGL